MTNLSLSLCFLLVGCGERDITGSDTQPDIRPYVTGAAERSVDDAGLFILPRPVASSTLPMIGPERARELALSYVLSFGSDLKRFWEQERGRSIDITKLQADMRVYFASTPYMLFPDGYHPATRRAFGSYYLVRMGAGAKSEVLVAVAAYNSELVVNERGKLVMSPLSGMEFTSTGIPVDTTRPGLSGLLTPEEVVTRVGRIAGTRVTEVPELVQLGYPLGPLFPAWKLTLERSVRVRTVNSSRTVDTSILYAGGVQGRELLVPSAEQPTVQEVQTVRIGSGGEDLGGSTVSLPILAGQPTRFEAVTVDRSGSK